MPSWTSKAPVLAILLLSAITAVGTAGYMVVEGWSLWDSFYMTIISLTTVGYREVHPLSPQGEVFTAVILILGVGTVLYSFTLIGARVIEGTLQQGWERRRVTYMLSQLKQHFIVCGYGRIGSIIVDEFVRQHVPYVVIERDAERARALRERGQLVIEGDASSEDVLTQAGVGRARGLIAAVSTDAENVYTILSARLMQPALYILGRAESDESARKIKRAGADRVISPYQLGGLHMAQLALRPTVVEFVQLATSSEFLDLSMEQIEVRDEGPLVGQTLIGANLRQIFGVIVVGIRRITGRMEFNPPPDARMEAGDHLVVLGPNERLAALNRHAGSRLPAT
ncbi:MAG: potassium channel protein [Vicinamibacterales bacterium]